MGIQIRWWSGGRQADRAVDKAFNDVFDFVMRALRDPDRAADVVLETMRRVRADIRQRKIPDNVKNYCLLVAGTVIVNELGTLLKVAPFAACIATAQPVPAWTALAKRGKPAPPDPPKQQVARAAWAELNALEVADRVLLDLNARRAIPIDTIALALKIPKARLTPRLKALTSTFERRVAARVVVERSSCATLAGLIEAGDLDEIDQHTSSCELCAPQRKTTIGVLSTLKTFALVPATNCVKGEIRKRVREEIEELERRIPLPRMVRVATVVAGSAFVLGGSGVALSRLAATDGGAIAQPSPSPSQSATSSVTPTISLLPSLTPSPAPTVIPVPGKPALTVSATETAVTLRWTKPASAAPIIRYALQRASGNSDFTFLGRATATSFLDRGIAAGRTYRYRVAAVNDAGRGAFSNPVSALVPARPSAPLNLVIDDSAGCDVVVSWSPPSSTGTAPISGYTVSWSRDGGQDPQTRRTSKTTLLETIEIGGIYTFTVRATNAVGTGPAISLTKELLPCPG